ncbi:MAG: UDP-N-acetylmuramate--L-alanine ligase [Syntrophomonadaceae bacterium]|nr:UDP-N-acetylmuramate--L-alanine ligase [Syntrophomonadaceae bacterium]
MTASSRQWIHMVGIAGAGMSGIARILRERSYKVSGSDLQSNDITKRLKDLGIEIYRGHSSSNLKEGVDLLVVSSAVPEDNCEVVLARERNIPILKRGQMLAELVKDSKNIAVAGAHGKTTTTSMIYVAFSDCGLDPTFIVGGQLQGSHLGAKLGGGEYSIVEADESDASFLELKPYIALITNIEDDHLDYYKSFDNIQSAFKLFLEGVKPGGFAVAYGEDACIQKIKKEVNTKIITYGEGPSNDYYLRNWQPKGMGSKFEVYSQGKNLGDVELSIPGKHNAINAVATIAIAAEIGLDIERVKKAIKKFKGAKRRFQIIGQKGGMTVVDDYAHHPTEIKATISAARACHNGRIVVIFQPHRYSRTSLLGRQLGEAFAGADLVVITEIYAAGEKSIPGITGEVVYNAARNAGYNAVFVPEFEKIYDYLLENVRANDLIITMGAGDVWKLGSVLLDKLPGSVLEA